MKLVGRAACVLIPVAAALSVQTLAQAWLLWVLVAIGAANAFEGVKALEWALGERPSTTQPTAPPPQLNARMKPQDPAALPLLHIKGL